jgi:hypothetical protein
VANVLAVAVVVRSACASATRRGTVGLVTTVILTTLVMPGGLQGRAVLLRRM